MAKKTYTRWEEYYSNEWLPKYNDIKILLSQPDGSIKIVYNNYRKFYYSTVKLIQMYLSCNGSPYNNNVALIRMAFRYCFLVNGDAWMMINDIMEHSHKYTTEDFIKYCLNDNFIIFDDLHTKFEELLKIDR